MKKTILLILLILFITITFFLNYLGVFSKITIEEKEAGPYQLVYHEQKGDYSQTGNTITEVSNALDNIQIETGNTFGIYYDNPKNTPTEKLRSEVGFIVSNLDSSTIHSLPDKLQYKEFSRQQCIVIQFPFKNKLSIFIGIFKVYPNLEKYIQQKGYQPSHVMELYGSDNITYVMPLIK